MKPTPLTPPADVSIEEIKQGFKEILNGLCKGIVDPEVLIHITDKIITFQNKVLAGYAAANQPQPQPNESIDDEINQAATDYSIRIVKGATEWAQSNPSKKKHFIDGAKFGYSLTAAKDGQAEGTTKKDYQDWNYHDWIKFVSWYSGMFESSVIGGIEQYKFTERE